MSKRRGRLLFVNKKKFFVDLAVLVSAPQAQKQKFFAPLFFKKAAASLFPAQPIMLS